MNRKEKEQERKKARLVTSIFAISSRLLYVIEESSLDIKSAGGPLKATLGPLMGP